MDDGDVGVFGGFVYCVGDVVFVFGVDGGYGVVVGFEVDGDCDVCGIDD